MNPIIVNTLTVILVLSTFSYIFATIFGNKLVKKSLIEAWCLSESHYERPHKAEVLSLIGLFLDSVYCTDNKLNIRKLIVIVTISNISMISYLILENTVGHNSLKGDNLSDEILMIMTSSLFFSVIFVEYFSYKLTRFFHNASKKTNTYKYIIIDIIFVVFVLYLIPFLLFLDIQSNVMHLYELIYGDFLFNSQDGDNYNNILYLFTTFITFIAPVVSFNFFSSELIIYINSDSSFYNIALPFIPTFSLCLPTTIVILGFSIFYNKHLFYFFSTFIEKLSERNFKNIKTGSITVFTFTSGYIGYLSFLSAV